MTKTKEIVPVKITDVATGKVIEYMTKKEPRKTEVGNYCIPKLNAIGIAFLQSKGFHVYDDSDVEYILKQAIPGLADEHFGTLGKWKTQEEREKFEVLVDGEVFDQIKTEQVVVEQPIVTPSVEISQPQVKADSSGIMELVYSGIQKGQEKGISNRKIQEQLVNKFGKETARKYWYCWKEVEAERKSPKAATVTEVPIVKPEPIKAVPQVQPVVQQPIVQSNVGSEDLF